MLHRPIPTLPLCPRARAITADVHRSYPTGRREISRAYAGIAFELAISTRNEFPAGVLASLVLTRSAGAGDEASKIPFAPRDAQTLVCSVTPERTGLYSFWAEFSVDGGQTWLHDPVPDAWVLVDPPQVDHLRMYTLIPSVSGTFADWAADLVRIKSLGFNTVHFLPLTTLDTSLSPYSAKSLFDVDGSYTDPATGRGGLAQLESLIEVAKALDLKLCFDLVLNHVGVDSDIARRAPEWITPDESTPDGLRRARYWSEHGWQPWNDLVLINYEHPSQLIRYDIWEYMQEYALFWAKYASETNGFVRFDNLHSSDKDFIDALTVKLRENYPSLAIIAEYFTDAATLLATVPKWGLSLILATPWDSRFVQQLRDYLKYIHSVSDHVRFFMPITSHDSGTPAQEFGSELSTVPRYVAAALLGTGATGMTQGVEWGQKEKVNFIGRQPRLMPVEPPKFGAVIRRVNAILAAEPAFRRGYNCQFIDNGHHAVIAAFRKDARPGQIGFLVICNFDILGEQDFDVDLSTALGTVDDIRCVDLLNGQAATFLKGVLSLKLAACAAHVLRVQVGQAAPAQETAGLSA